MLYQESQNAVTVVDGVYSVTLGAGTSPSGPFSASLFSQPDLWRRVMTQGMRKDYSWAASARRYVELYELTLSQVRHTVLA